MPYIGNIVQDFSVNTAMLNSDSVTSIKIDDGTIVNADINDSAAIAGTKIDPSFTSNLTVTNTAPALVLVDSDHNSDFNIQASGGVLAFNDSTNSATRISITSDGKVNFGSVARVEVDGVFKSAHGSAATPAYNFLNDNDNGMFRVTTNTIGFSTAGTERVRINSSGNVGIGAASIDRLFHVEGTDNVLGKFQNDQSICLIEFEDTDTTSGNRPSIGSDGNNAIVFAGGSERLRIDSSGRVGVGLTPHTSDVATSITEGLLQTDGNIDIRYGGTNSDPAGARYLNFINTDTTLVAGQPMGGLHWIGMDSNNPNSITAAILADCSGNQGTASHLLFKTSGSERMRIDATSGQLLVGTTAVTSADAVVTGIRAANTTRIVVGNSNTSASGVAGYDMLPSNTVTGARIECRATEDFSTSANRTADLGFYTRLDGTLAEKLTILSSGNVGINTTSPSQKLHVNGNVGINANLIHNGDTDTMLSFSADNQVDIQCASTRIGRFTTNGIATGPNKRIDILDASEHRSGVIDNCDSGANSLRLSADPDNSGSSSYMLFAVDGGSEKMRIDSSGRVGIGTSSPVNPLHVVLAGTDVATFESTDAGSSGSQVSFKHTSASPADNDTIANLTFDGRDDGNNATTYAQLRVLATDVSNGSESGDIQFFTRGTGTFAERFRIRNTGNISIQTNDVGFSGAGTLRINSGSTAGALNLDGGSSNHGGEINLTGGSNGGRIQFRTGQGAGQQSERMRLDENGNLAVGTTTAVNNSGYGGMTLNGGSGAIFSLKDSDIEKTRLALVANDTFSIQYPPGNSGIFRIDQLTADGSGNITGATERARVTNDGKFLMGNTGSLDMGFGPQVLSIRAGNSAGYDGTAAAIFGQLDNDAATCIFYNASSTNGTNMLDTRCARSNDAAYTFHIMRSNSANDTEFRWRGDGNAFADGSFSGGGADYAEYFEWSDGNTSDEDRRGYTVVLDGNKIRKSTSSDTAATIIGVVSGNPSVVGDTDLDKWKQKYKRDDYGTYLRDSNGERVLNPTWDESIEYVSREKRKEWSTIGLMGKIRIRKGQTMGTNWIKMRDISDSVEEWLIR